MCLRLIIAATIPELFSTWSKVFSNIEKTRVLDLDIQTLHRLPELDAELLMSWLVHERYGGTSKTGQSQILSTRGELGMPPWVITTAPFAAHLEKHRQPDGSIGVEIVQNEKLTPEEEDYIVFSKVFKRIAEFNQQDVELKIKTLGFSLDLLRFRRGELHKEAEAVRQAYLEQCQCI